jgi:hypothetical protein
MEQMLECLLAEMNVMQEKMNINLERMEGNMDAWLEEMKI